MRSLPCWGAALPWALAFAAACSVDQSGLETSAKLSHDAGLPITGTGGTGSTFTGTGGAGGEIIVPGGSGGQQPGTGGASLGTGGASVGSGGATLGSGGTSPATGGAVGAGGTAGADAAGGTAGQAGGSSGGGGTGGSPGAGGAAGFPGTGGAGGLGGTGATGGMGGFFGFGGRGGSGHCNAMTCTGCCASNVCVTTVSAQQCGARGAACTACGPCQTCSLAGACAIDPGSQWTIVAASAQVSMSTPSGGTWDPYRGDEGGPAPDLFCEFENPAGNVTPTTAGVTTTLVDTYAASWNQTITPGGVTVSASALMAGKPAWRIWVGDEDCSKTNVCTSGQVICSYQQPFTAAQLMSGSASITNLQSCLSLDLTLVCASAP